MADVPEQAPQSGRIAAQQPRRNAEVGLPDRLAQNAHRKGEHTHGERIPAGHSGAVGVGDQERDTLQAGDVEQAGRRTVPGEARVTAPDGPHPLHGDRTPDPGPAGADEPGEAAGPGGAPREVAQQQSQWSHVGDAEDHLRRHASDGLADARARHHREALLPDGPDVERLIEAVAEQAERQQPHVRGQLRDAHEIGERVTEDDADDPDGH